MKINFFTSALFLSLFDCIKTSTQTFHKIIYKTIILARRAIKFLHLNFLNISNVLALLDYIIKLNPKRLEPSR